MVCEGRAARAALGWCLALAVLPASVAAADAERGARLYLQLPGGVVACVNCHGPDPAASRNNLLRAAGQPDLLLKALNAIGVMGYLKPVLSDADREDLAAYLDAVARLAATERLAVWPRTVEFGALELGQATPSATVHWRNRSTDVMAAPVPRLAAGQFLLSHDCAGPLAPGAGCRIELRAAPGRLGPIADTLVLEGTPAAVLGVSATVRAEPVATLATDRNGAALAFGSVGVGDTASRTITLRNPGPVAVSLGVATFTGPGAAAYSGDGGCASGSSLAPGQRCTLTLSFRPGAAVSYEALLQWRSNGGNPESVTLQGQGAAVAPPPAGNGGNGGSSGGGGCAAAPAARHGDASLLALLLGAAAALGWRRRRAPVQARKAASAWPTTAGGSAT